MADEPSTMAPPADPPSAWFTVVEPRGTDLTRKRESERAATRLWEAVQAWMRR